MTTFRPGWIPAVDKARTPYHTIKTIRDILFENDIFTLEEAWYNHSTMRPFNSVGIAMPGTNLTTAGKGRNEQYALASGYAEWMERIQTLFLVRSNFYVGNQNVSPVCFPNGSPFVFEEYVDTHEDILKFLFNSSDIRELEFLSTHSENVFLHQRKRGRIFILDIPQQQNMYAL